MRVLEFLLTLVRFLWRRDVKSWREHRRAAMALLPASEKRDDAENGK